MKKKNAPETPALEIKPELLDELVKGPMTPEQFEAMFQGLKKAIVERALGGVDPLSWTSSSFGKEGSPGMPKTRLPYPAEFRQKIVDLVRAGRSVKELAEEFEPSEQTIHNWLAEADADGGKRRDLLTSAEREELVKLRRAAQLGARFIMSLRPLGARRNCRAKTQRARITTARARLRTPNGAVQYVPVPKASF
ncbi:MAG: hypothetical protein A3G81_18980 [Betaproteobacteria bacterium RIFCSPLOWO2_12_FULL_65_14]|nr:MAG: hypothetical protein A3G81_18980 [Betaproteobacteria bacterium RIFCSPLOWO2_12_FULL_65_14]